jgi:hypothetical protein
MRANDDQQEASATSSELREQSGLKGPREKLHRAIALAATTQDFSTGSPRRATTTTERLIVTVIAATRNVRKIAVNAALSRR